MEKAKQISQAMASSTQESNCQPCGDSITECPFPAETTTENLSQKADRLQNQLKALEEKLNLLLSINKQRISSNKSDFDKSNDKAVGKCKSKENVTNKPNDGCKSTTECSLLFEKFGGIGLGSEAPATIMMNGVKQDLNKIVEDSKKVAFNAQKSCDICPGSVYIEPASDPQGNKLIKLEKLSVSSSDVESPVSPVGPVAPAVPAAPASPDNPVKTADSIAKTPKKTGFFAKLFHGKGC